MKESLTITVAPPEGEEQNTLPASGVWGLSVLLFACLTAIAVRARGN